MIFLILLPQVLGITHINQVVQFAIDATFAVSLNLLLGYAGLLSFGHAMFFGVGAYAAALALTHVPEPSLADGRRPRGLDGGRAGPPSQSLPGAGQRDRLCHARLGLRPDCFYVFCLKYREVTGGGGNRGDFPRPACASRGSGWWTSRSLPTSTTSPWPSSHSASGPCGS